MTSLIFINILLLGLLTLSYLVFQQEILSPTFICVGMYFLSCFLMIFYRDEWKVDLSFLTIGIIAISLISVGVGEFMATRVRIFAPKNNTRVISDDISFEAQHREYIKINRIAITICLLFVVLTAILYFREISLIAANSVYASSTDAFLMQVRWAKLLEGAEVAYYVQQMYSFSETIACVLLYILIHNRVFAMKAKRMYAAYLTIIVYIGTSFMTTGRAKMLNFFIYAIFVWLLLIAKKKNWKFENNIKLILRVILILAFAIILFYLAGFLTEKSLHTDNFFDGFAIYFSSSIYAFNEYVKNPANFEGNNNFFGIHTFSGIYTLLRKLGFQIPDSIISLEYINCGKYLTNVYTPLRRYLQDFGIFGTMVIMFLIGFIYKKLIWLNKNRNSSHLILIITSYFVFPIIYISIEERVFMDVLMMRSVYTIVYFILIYQWLVNSKFFNFKIHI